MEGESYGPCSSFFSFTFPVAWLAETDAELERLVAVEKELREEKERKAEEEGRIKEKREKERRELEQYQKLKAKFEP